MQDGGAGAVRSEGVGEDATERDKAEGGGEGRTLDVGEGHGGCVCDEERQDQRMMVGGWDGWGMVERGNVELTAHCKRRHVQSVLLSP